MPPRTAATGQRQSGETTAPPALSFEGVSFRFPEAKTPALDRVSLVVDAGERLGILGPNGGGKSTLLRLALGLLTPSQGRVRVMGLSPLQAREQGLMGWVPQRIEAELRFPLSVRDVAMMPALRRVSKWSRPSPELIAQVDDALRLVGMHDLADRPIGKLSGGQLQRVMIARAVAHRPRVLLLDEPTVGVDVVGQERFAAMMQRLHEALGLTIVTVSHDLRTVAASSDRVACLNRTLHAHTSPQGLTPQVLAEVFRHDVLGIFGELHIEAHRPEDCPDPSHAPASNASPSACCGHEHTHHHDSPPTPPKAGA